MYYSQSLGINTQEAFELDAILTRRGRAAAVDYVRTHMHLPLQPARQLVESRDALVHPADTHEMPLAGLTGDGYTEFRIAAAVLSCVGVAMLLASAWLWYRQHVITAQGVTVDAVVGVMQPVSSGQAPVFDYQWNDRALQYHSMMGARRPAYQAGDTVQLFVDPQYPHRVVVNDFLHRWLLVTVLATLGIGLSGAGLLLQCTAAARR